MKRLITIFERLWSRRLGLQRSEVRVTSGGASDEHPMSTRWASDGGRWKYAAMLVMLFTLGIGQMWGADVTDVITASDLAATGTSYTNFSGVTKTSDAVYAGNSALNNSVNIQLRSSGSTAGIVSTTSGGRRVKSVKITVASGSNTIKVYGKTTAYSAASDLYNNSTKGTEIGSTSSTATLTITGDYTFVGIRSNSGAVYISSIEITWETTAGCSGTALSTPSVTATPSSNKLVLSWPNVDNATKYQVSWNGGAYADATSPFTKNSLSNGTTYTWAVKAIGDGSTWCNSEAAEGSSIPGTYYTVTFMNNGSTYDTKSIRSGQNLVLPDAPSSCDPAKEFVGWATAAIVGSTNTKPTFVSSLTTIGSAQTYYAVFATKTANKYELGAKADLIDGRQVLIVNPSANKAMSGTASSSGKLGGVDVTISSSTITKNDATIIWTVGIKNGNYQFKRDNKFLNSTGNNAYCDSDEDTWSVTVNSNKNILRSQNSSKDLECYNGNFYCYNTGTSDYYKMDIYIPEYKNYVTTCGTEVELSKGAETNGSFTLSPASSVTTTSSAQTVNVTCTPNAGYYVSAVSATNPATGTATPGGSGNARTVTYSSGANGTSTISVTFSPIWYLKGDFNTWGTGNPCTTIADGVASTTVDLAKNTKYVFQFYDASQATDAAAYHGNNGNIVEDISGWTFATGNPSSNCKIFTGKAGTYTFKINMSTKAVQIIYPTVSDHPNDAYNYFKKWADWNDNYFVHWWDGSDIPVQDYNSAIRVTKTANICETDYVYFPILTSYTNFKVKDAASGDGSHRTGNITSSNTHGGDYHDCTNWREFETYDISYDKGTGSGATMASETDICPGGEQALSTNTYTKDHYHFTGWIADRDVTINSATVTQGTLITGTPTIQNIQHDIELEAQWEINSHTLTWNWNGGSTSSTTYTLYPATSGSVNYGAGITKPAGGTMSKTGYDFSSWSSNATTMPDNALTITANWTAQTYTITYKDQGDVAYSGSNLASLPSSHTYGASTALVNGTKTGYTFGGWYTDAECTISAGSSIGATTKTANFTLYAKWTAITYTVAFDKNHASASGSMSNQTGFTYGVGKALSECTFTAPTHKYFYGWHRTKAQADAGNREYTDKQSVTDLTTTNGATVTLYAVWKDHTFTNYRTNCADMYDIVLNKNGGTTDGSAKVADNGTSLSSIVAPTRSGYDIEGYYTTSGLAAKIATDEGALSKNVTVSGDAWTNGSNQWVLGDGATFYTKWTAHVYDISYEGLEGASNTNPATYTIETATIVLANPGSRTGYTFTGWTLGGSPITQIALGSTGDKTITANWTLNQHAVAVSAVDNVVITATPASEAAIAESASRNVNYNKTVTLNCTPDDHWNLVWDVYKTGSNPKETVSLTGSGDGATFTMPDYNVTVSAVMSEDTYHTATFKNNGAVIDGYNAVKTYDGTRPTAPTLTDITDACDKTECNMFYGWIAEAGIWPQTINSVAGKTIYRHASSIPVIDGANVVYHAVWAKGDGAPEAPHTTIAYWANQSLTQNVGVSATTGSGTMTSNTTLNQNGTNTHWNGSGGGAQIDISGLDLSEYSGIHISFYARSSQAVSITVSYSTNGSDYTTVGSTASLTGNEVGYTIDGIPNTATYLRLKHNTTTGSIYFGTVTIAATLSGTYSFTKLTAENTVGWAGADWDGTYIITNRQPTIQALDGNGISATGLVNVTPSEGVITSDMNKAFAVEYSAGNGYAVRAVGADQYLWWANNSVASYVDITDHYCSEFALETIIANGKYLSYNTSGSKMGFYNGKQTDWPDLYKILPTYSKFRITCCDKKITIGTVTKTGSASSTVTFESGGDAVAVGETVETCQGATITATVTPVNGYQCTALTFSRADEEDITIDPAISVPFTGATDFELTFETDANTTLMTSATFVALHDYYIDNMHYNATVDKSGNYGTAPNLSSETKGSECTGLHYKFIGWIPESDMNMTTGVPTSTANMVAGGATGKYATGTNYYAIWAEEE